MQDRVVLAMGEGGFKSVEVALGRTGDSQTEIISGLESGDRIVTSAHFLLDSESSITSDFLRMAGSSADTINSGGGQPDQPQSMPMTTPMTMPMTTPTDAEQAEHHDH